jgi:polysaccharide export outer membrane protein
VIANKKAHLGALLAALSIAACGTSTKNMLPPSECPEPTFISEEYLIGAGDMLNVVVWRHEELTTTIPVRPDGRISTPLVDDILASGKTPTQLAEDMEVVLAEYLRTPEVSIIVTGQGAANQIQVVGEVTTPQALSYREGVKVLDVIVSAGGLTEFAAGNNAHIVRSTATGQVECKVQLKRLMGGDMSQNINVFPGDVLVVPETSF